VVEICYRASRAVTSMNSVEFCKKPTYSEKSARLKFGVFQQNVCHEALKKQEVTESVVTLAEMEVGPPEPPCRGRL
jgi:hypothetical protein